MARRESCRLVDSEQRLEPADILEKLLGLFSAGGCLCGEFLRELPQRGDVCLCAVGLGVLLRCQPLLSREGVLYYREPLGRLLAESSEQRRDLADERADGREPLRGELF